MKLSGEWGWCENGSCTYHNSSLYIRCPRSSCFPFWMTNTDYRRLLVGRLISSWLHTITAHHFSQRWPFLLHGAPHRCTAGTSLMAWRRVSLSNSASAASATGMVPTEHAAHRQTNKQTPHHLHLHLHLHHLLTKEKTNKHKGLGLRLRWGAQS